MFEDQFAFTNMILKNGTVNESLLVFFLIIGFNGTSNIFVLHKDRVIVHINLLKVLSYFVGASYSQTLKIQY